MTPEALAALHATGFEGPARWSAAGFADLLADPATFLCARPGAALMGRIMVDEAELLTLIVHPDRRRAGLARRLLDAFDATARERGARRAFLEVSAVNGAALGLYAATGWHEVGRRPGYYASTDALILRKVI